MTIHPDDDINRCLIHDYLYNYGEHGIGNIAINLDLSRAEVARLIKHPWFEVKVNKVGIAIKHSHGAIK